MILIIDYGMGNLASVFNAFKYVGCGDVLISSKPEDLSKADKLVLPGVGAFEDAMKNLKASGMDSAIVDCVRKGKPFLGICLGFHLMFEKGFEGGEFEGLGLLKGDVRRFDVKLPVPHMGWNQAKLDLRSDSQMKGNIFEGMEKGTYFYFDHAYYPLVREEGVAKAITEYETEFVSAIWKDNVYGAQFHPEKSHRNGLRIVERFSALN